MKYNLRKIMLRAWKNYRKASGEITFAEALHRVWLSAKAETVNEQRIEAAKMAEGVQEETNTYSGWKNLGYEVIHGSKSLFGAALTGVAVEMVKRIRRGSLDGRRFRRSPQHKEIALASAPTLTGAATG